ncbi:MAG TPA: hypothetical protein DCE41_18260 [Cytophagales bacterium]|nr:hypothetical protein [Cytophagales bacterium]HAA22227.1 hypothetical protein [Cytophagales bacterium]HAP58332.1 hypothetical protein [Cytophagales bacterium]
MKNIIQNLMLIGIVAPLAMACTESELNIVDKPEVMAEFPGGHSAFMQYVKENLEYPAEARKVGIQGNVYISFLVTEDGQIREARVERGVNDYLDEEALRVIEQMEDWEPAENNGEKVTMRILLPIKFRLEGGEELSLPKMGTEDVFEIVEEPPHFGEGKNQLFRYLFEHIKYPESAEEEGIEGQVIVQFVVDADGKVTEVEIAEGEYDALNAEAKRVVQEMPSWTPGVQRGQRVKVRMQVPVYFKLD